MEKGEALTTSVSLKVEKDLMFKDNLQSRFNQEKDKVTAWFVMCHDYLPNGKGDLKRHVGSPKHITSTKITERKFKEE